MTVYKVFWLECAHWLPNVPQEHKCRRLHGHSYRVELHVGGPMGGDTGWIIDYADMAAAWQPVHARLDHRLLNDVGGLENPTCENLALWIAKRVREYLPGLQRIVIGETCTAGVMLDLETAGKEGKA